MIKLDHDNARRESDVGWRRRKTQTTLRHREIGGRKEIYVTGEIASGCFQQCSAQTEAGQ